MEMTQILKIGKELGLEGTDLLSFIDRKEKEAMEREERKEREALEREERKEKERLERESKLEKEQAEREERAKTREDRIKELELENLIKMKLMELENKAKLDMLERQVELEKVKVHAAEIGKDVSVKHLSKGPKLPHFEDSKDDMDAYLNRFERFAESAGWPQKDWAVSLSALLKGKSLEVYSRLSIAEANDYKKVKTALLRRFALTQEGFRQKFRSCLPESSESAPQFAVRIESYLIRWIEMAGADKSFNGLKDLLLREQFINASQTDLALFLKERKPGNISEMAELAEQYLEAHGNLFMTQGKMAPQGKKFDNSGKHENRSKPPGGVGKSITAEGRQLRTYYFCKKQSHVLKDCFERQRQLKNQGGKQAAGFFSCVDDQTEVKVGEVQDDVLEASACYSGGKWDHECCIHDNKVRLECGHE